MAVVAVLVGVPAAQAVSSAEAAGIRIIYQATNQHRANNGEPGLLQAAQLDTIAQVWSERMLSDYKRHGDLDAAFRHNPNYWTQMPNAGKQSGGENIAANCGYGSASQAANRLMDQWKESPPHNASMLNGSYNYIGVGFAYDSQSGCAFGTQNFGQYSQPLQLAHEFIDVPRSHQFYREITWLSNSGITNGWSDGTFRPRDAVSREAFAAFLYRDAGRPPVTLPAQSPFKDVPKNAQFYKEIVWLEQQNITNGWSDGTFRPRESIDRNAMAAFLYRYEGRPSFTPPSTSPFRDLTRNSKFYKEITWLDTRGITNGWSDGTFRPHGKVTREATAAFFHRLNGRP